MVDLFIGLSIVLVMTGMAFTAAIRIASRVPRSVSLILSAAALLTVLLFVGKVRDTVFLAEYLPFSNLIVVGNAVPPAVGFLAGIAWCLAPGGYLRRSLLTALPLTMGLFSAASPLMGQAPQCGDQWSRAGHCIQTTDQTCSAASAATLLKSYGIPATEQEMAVLCLTREGTTWQGLYRGLKRKTAGSEWDVEVFACSSVQLPTEAEGPSILSVGLEDDEGWSSKLHMEMGWTPGVGHSVVLMDFDSDGRAIIADPSVRNGYETWTAIDLHSLWRGYGLRLVKR